MILLGFNWFSQRHLFNSMHISNDIKDAIQCLWYRKVRSLLSAAGIAIGTTALVAMLSISEGARHQAQENILALGVDSIRLESNVDTEKTAGFNNQNLYKGIRSEDIESIKSSITTQRIGYFKYFQGEELLIAGRPIKGDVLLVNQAWFSSENIDLNRGRLINENDILSFGQVCLLGADIGKNSSIGNTVIGWKNSSCNLIGTLSKKGKMLIEGSVLSTIDINNSVIMPIDQYSSIIDYYTGVTIKVGTDDGDEIKSISSNISNLLNQTHRADDYSILLPVTLLEKSQQEQAMFNLIMGSIAGLSLLVGGIGIMNVMLAHLAEQTREIGLRLSVGAQKIRIIQLFLGYSLMLAVTGTLIGVFTGIALTVFIQQYAEWPVKFSLFSLTVGPLFSILAGAIFGLYPAMKASKIQPNIALRQV